MTGRVTKEEHRRDLEIIVDLAITKMDLAVTKEIGEVKRDIATIPPLIDKKIACYDDKQRSRRRWTIRTIIATIGLMLTAIGFLIAHWPT